MDCMTAVGWTPEGRRTRERAKTTWRRTIEKEREPGRVAELECSQSGSTKQGGLCRQRDDLMRPLARSSKSLLN